MSWAEDSRRFHRAVQKLGQAMRPIYDKIISLRTAGLVKPLEQTMGSKEFIVSIVAPGLPVEPGTDRITLTLDGTTLDPDSYNDWFMAGFYLKLAGPENFNTWLQWAEQSVVHRQIGHEADHVRKWATFSETSPAPVYAYGGVANVPKDGTTLLEKGERVIPWPTPTKSTQLGHPPVTDLQVGTLVHSTVNSIGLLLDRYTDISGNAILVTDLSTLQHELNELICTEVLKAKDLTVRDLVALGLLTEDELANHFADVCSALHGSDISAKQAMQLAKSLKE